VIDRLVLPKTYVAADDVQTPKIPRAVYNGKYIRSYDYVKTPSSLREQMVRVCQTVTGIDRMVGNLRAELKRQGLADNTIIVFSSDHGIQFGEHGLGGKVLLYDESLHVPLIVYDPRLPAERQGKRISEFALAEDVAPTVLSLAGLKPPSSMQGKSLGPLLRGQQTQWRKDFFCENLYTGQNYPRIEAVRGKEWKYIRYFKRPQPLTPYARALTASIRGEKPIYEELYCLANDPHEQRNLAGVSKHSAKLTEMRERCQQLVKEAKGGPGGPLTITRPQHPPKAMGKGTKRTQR